MSDWILSTSRSRNLDKNVHSLYCECFGGCTPIYKNFEDPSFEEQFSKGDRRALLIKNVTGQNGINLAMSSYRYISRC